MDRLVSKPIIKEISNRIGHLTSKACSSSQMSMIRNSSSKVSSIVETSKNFRIRRINLYNNTLISLIHLLKPIIRWTSSLLRASFRKSKSSVFAKRLKPSSLINKIFKNLGNSYSSLSALLDRPPLTSIKSEWEV